MRTIHKVHKEQRDQIREVLKYGGMNSPYACTPEVLLGLLDLAEAAEEKAAAWDWAVAKATGGGEDEPGSVSISFCGVDWGVYHGDKMLAAGPTALAAVNAAKETR